MRTSEMVRHLARLQEALDQLDQMNYGQARRELMVLAHTFREELDKEQEWQE